MQCVPRIHPCKRWYLSYRNVTYYLQTYNNKAKKYNTYSFIVVLQFVIFPVRVISCCTILQVPFQCVICVHALKKNKWTLQFITVLFILHRKYIIVHIHLERWRTFPIGERVSYPVTKNKKQHAYYFQCAWLSFLHFVVGCTTCNALTCTCSKTIGLTRLHTVILYTDFLYSTFLWFDRCVNTYRILYRKDITWSSCLMVPFLEESTCNYTFIGTNKCIVKLVTYLHNMHLVSIRGAGNVPQINRPNPYTHCVCSKYLSWGCWIFG